jgi:hypothetical protein
VQRVLAVGIAHLVGKPVVRGCRLVEGRLAVLKNFELQARFVVITCAAAHLQKHKR